jgi:hypothetical protein
LTRFRQSSASSFAARLVDPTRSQNITVIGRRSASVPDVDGDGDGWAEAGFAADGGVPLAERAAIARMSRLRCPSGTPIFSRSASARSGRTSASISCSRNRVSYSPRSIAFSHWATFIVVPAHGSSLMMVPGRLRVQVGSVGRPLWGRFDPFTTPPGNGCYLRIAAGDLNRRGRAGSAPHRNRLGKGPEREPKPRARNRLHRSKRRFTEFGDERQCVDSGSLRRLHSPIAHSKR